MKIIGAAPGSIIATTSTVQTATKTAAPTNDHPPAPTPPMAMPAMPSADMPPRTATPIGMLMLAACQIVSSQAAPVRVASDMSRPRGT